MRGYRWAMTYRGFETYRYVGKRTDRHEWVMTPAESVTRMAREQKRFAQVPSFSGNDDVELMNKVDEFWTESGL